MSQVPSAPLLAKALAVSVDADIKFAEPWEAKVFAIVVNMAQAGHFTWSEWVECFSGEVAAATAVEAAGGTPRTYYEQWLDAAERLMVDKGVTSRAQLAAKRFAIGAVGATHVLK
jgi:nitrile hydratase accessory protein